MQGTTIGRAPGARHAPTAAGRGAANVDRGAAGRWLWAALLVLLVTVTVGRNWDAAWHVRNAFESFWSPPHVFIYATTALNAAMIVHLALSPALRAAFGPPGVEWVRLAVLARPARTAGGCALPAPLVLLGGGFAVLGFAGGVLDNAWHSAFGLDETAWSTPHAMLGWAWLTICLGFLTCRLALRPGERLPWYTYLLLSCLLLAFSLGPCLGPLKQNNTPDVVHAIAAIPTLAAQPPFQHTARIYLDWNLTRTNPLLVPLGALWAAAVLALLRRLDGRGWLLLLAVALWSVVTLVGERGQARQLDQFLRGRVSADPAAWLPLPLLPMALAYLGLARLARGARGGDRLAWALAGVVFGIGVCAVWRPGEVGWLLLPVAGVAAALGSAVGERVHAVLIRPTRRGVLALLGAALLVPLLSGVVDLALRLHTP